MRQGRRNCLAFPCVRSMRGLTRRLDNILRILVSDTSVIIDLERGAFLEELFKLPFNFAVPDLLFRRELGGALGESLVALGLRIEELTSSEVTRGNRQLVERVDVMKPTLVRSIVT